MTTHVGLVARAFGADRVVLPAAAEGADTVRDVTARFGGSVEVETTRSPRDVLGDWSGSIAHLTMYGERLQDVIDDVRTPATESLLVAVGAGKVPGSVYDRADWNVAVTNQPHSEVAALALFLDRLFDGRELDREWTGGTHRVIPDPHGKRVVPVDGGDSA